jgi:hypothetical protein
MKNIGGIDTPFYYRKIHTPPPSIHLVTVPNSKDRNYRISRSTDLHSSHMIDLHVNNFYVPDRASLSFGWQRHSTKITQVTPAPDVAYRNTYLEGPQRKKSDINNDHNHSRPLSNYSFSYLRSKSPQQKYDSHQYHSIYDYIRNSIRHVEQQRKLKQDISLHIKRPQNEDMTLRRILSKRSASARTSVSRNGLTETTPLSLNNDLQSSPTIVNYINHIRVLHSTTPNQSNRQQKLT